MADELMAGVPALLRRLGATDDELETAVRRGSVAALALELVLRHGEAPYSVDAAAAHCRVDPEDVLEVWQALGFPADGDAALLPADVVNGLPLLTGGLGTRLGDATALGIARVVGSATARVAEAVVDSLRVDFELPQLDAGTRYVDVVESYTEMTRELLPAFEAFLLATLRAHLVRVAAGAWSPDESRQAARRELLVGFVDLVGFTSLARTLTPAELAGLVNRFEDLVADTVGRHGARLVKLIGDGALFVADDVAAGCRAALALAAALSDSATLPTARIGADAGSVVAVYGDYYGDVVNRAARLVALARPGTVVVSEDVVGAAPDALTVEQLPSRALKGFQAPAATFRLLAADR